MTDKLEKIRYFLLVVLIIIFPLNQQIHLRPFPNVEGVIIDYLITKISLPEMLLIIFSFFNIPNIYKSLRYQLQINKFGIFLLIVSFLMLVLNTFRSEFINLAIYENLILLLIGLNSLTIKTYSKINLSFVLANSLKFWMSVLLLLGLLQVYFQESFFDNYYYFGEFTYSSDNYHIKQDGFIFDKLIPAYGIFSHSNIYGAFFLLSSMLLHLIKKNTSFFVLLGISGVILSGSLNILIGMILFLIFYYLKIDLRIIILYPIFLFLFLNWGSLNYLSYVDDLSVYRRLYMIHLSNTKFIEDPINFIFGFGYYNYFRVVSDNLFLYEIIRFFQPPHNVFYLIIWNYGLLFLLTFLIIFFKLIKNTDYDSKLVFLILISISMLDHFLFTNHQLKMLLFLLLPYSLFKVSSIKIK